MEMKYCGSCFQEKPISEFNKNKAKKDGLSTKCKKCNKYYLKEHYQDNKEYYHSKKKDFISALRDKVIEMKEKNPCVDCKQFYPACAMDYDHIEDNKIMSVSTLISFGNWEKIETEIKKCELVCSNCHRIRTSKRHKDK